MKKTILGSILINVLLLAGCQSQSPANTTHFGTDIRQSPTKSKKTSTTQHQKNSIDPSKIVLDHIVGKTYQLMPVSYDGIEAAQAMEEGKAPQNLIHDGGQTINFITPTKAYIELAGTYRPNYTTTYTVSHNTITLKYSQIAYQYHGNQIAFKPKNTTSDGHTITWSFEPGESSVLKSETDWKNARVDTKNLTTDQLKAWVSAVLEKQFTMQDYHFPYRLTVTNHNGLAYVNVDVANNQVDTYAVFRVNQDGILEQEYGHPQQEYVMSTLFMDTSSVRLPWQ